MADDLPEVSTGTTPEQRDDGLTRLALREAEVVVDEGEGGRAAVQLAIDRPAHLLTEVVVELVDEGLGGSGNRAGCARFWLHLHQLYTTKAPTLS